MSLSYIFFANEIKQNNDDHFLCVSFMEFSWESVFYFKTNNIKKSICKTIMSEENFQYITEPLKSLILTPSANSGLKFFSS